MWNECTVNLNCSKARKSLLHDRFGTQFDFFLIRFTIQHLIVYINEEWIELIELNCEK